MQLLAIITRPRDGVLIPEQERLKQMKKKKHETREHQKGSAEL